MRTKPEIPTQLDYVVNCEILRAKAYNRGRQQMFGDYMISTKVVGKTVQCVATSSDGKILRDLEKPL